ncbi:MAG: hypothetical protein AB8H79_05495 [Myxococcota bacterium]
MRYLTTLLALSALTACNGDTVVDGNDVPIAIIGDDIAQPANLRVFLDGRASFDADGDVLEYHWTLDHAPTGSALSEQVGPLSPNHSTDASTTSFQPDVPGVYVVALRTNDGKDYSDPTYLIVTAGDPTDCPKADAGNDQILPMGETAYLDGGQSEDPQNGVLDFDWTVVEKPFNSRLAVDDVTNGDQKQAEFTADVGGLYRIGLTVDNGQCESPPDSVEIVFEGDNQMPTANASGDFTAQDCIDVPLNCSASSDPDNDRLFYWWTVQATPSNSAVDNRSFNNQNAAEPNVFFDIAGDYQLACSVYDGKAWSKPDTITVTVEERDFNTPPIVDAGPDIAVDLGITECKQERANSWSPLITSCEKAIPEENVSIEAVVSDPDGDAYTIQWEMVRDSRARIRGRDQELGVEIEPPSFQPSVIGITEDFSYARLSAQDCTLEIGTDEVEIHTFVDGVLN